MFNSGPYIYICTVEKKVFFELYFLFMLNKLLTSLSTWSQHFPCCISTRNICFLFVVVFLIFSRPENESKQGLFYISRHVYT